MIPTARLTYVTEVGGDWAALYINGVTDLQNHSLSMLDVLEELEDRAIISVEHFEVDSEEGFAAWMGPRGFPEELSDIPQEARIT